VQRIVAVDADAAVEVGGGVHDALAALGRPVLGHRDLGRRREACRQTGGGLPGGQPDGLGVHVGVGGALADGLEGGDRLPELFPRLRVLGHQRDRGGGGPGLNWNGKPKQFGFHYYVPDCDATYARALDAGAKSVQAPADQFYGERSGTVQDSAGNYWYIATRLTGDYKWEGAPDIQPSLHPLRAEPVIDFLKRAFEADEIGRHATPDGVIQHVTMKIGNSYLEMGEAHGRYQPMPGMFYLYVPDCDASYQRAVAAGGKSVMEPTDHPYGDRSGAVQDAFGNEWWIATHIKDVPA